MNKDYQKFLEFSSVEKFIDRKRRCEVDNNIINLELGGQHILLAWFPEYETLGAFKAQDGKMQKEIKIDPYGNTTGGKLERIHTYPELLWMVWSHWFPDTEVLQ